LRVVALEEVAQRVQVVGVDVVDLCGEQLPPDGLALRCDLSSDVAQKRTR